MSHTSLLLVSFHDPPGSCLISSTVPFNDTIETQHFVPYNEVSLTQGLLVYFR